MRARLGGGSCWLVLLLAVPLLVVLMCASNLGRLDTSASLAGESQ